MSKNKIMNKKIKKDSIEKSIRNDTIGTNFLIFIALAGLVCKVLSYTIFKESVFTSVTGSVLFMVLSFSVLIFATYSKDGLSEIKEAYDKNILTKNTITDKVLPEVISKLYKKTDRKTMIIAITSGAIIEVLIFVLYYNVTQYADIGASILSDIITFLALAAAYKNNNNNYRIAKYYQYLNQ